MFGFHKETAETVVFDISKKNTNVLLLSKMHNVVEIGLTTGESKDPEVTTLYNLMK